LAVLRLDEKSVSSLAGMRFATQLDVDTSEPAATDAYCVVGFPNDPQFRSTRVNAWKAKPFVCAGVLGQKLPPLQNHDQRAHIVLDVDLSMLVDGNGQAASIPAVLRGISGGLIVRLPTVSGLPSLVAVQHAVFPSRDRLLVRGTLWSYVFGLFNLELKGISSAISLLLPKHSR
jgi:hypothetical protein